jgi:hypothetical protein
VSDTNVGCRSLTCSAAVLTASVLALVGVAGCSSDMPDTDPQVAMTTPSLTARAAAEAGAIAAYNGLWQAMAKAGQVPDPDDPQLRRYAGGDALRGVIGALVTYRETGVVTRGAPVTKPRVHSVSPPDHPNKVDLVDCGDSSH